MAKMTISGLEELELKLSKLGSMTEEVAKRVVIAGAQPVADEIRKGLESLPIDNLKYLKSGDRFNVSPLGEVEDLKKSLGITPPKVDNDGNINVKVGFDGYGSYPTKEYPKGHPNALIARGIESGSSVRQKKPFVRPAVNRSKKKALEEMQKIADEEIEIIMK